MQDYIPVETNVHMLDCAKAWSQLNLREKMYTYFIARASWEGAKVCTFQR
jgi:hypothetical protein